MGYLYQDIMNVEGLSGNSGERQAQLYYKLGGAPGSYTGSYEQNIALYNAIQDGTAQRVAQPQPQQGGGGNILSPNTVTPFSKVLPYDTLFNPNLITALAESQINPEAQRTAKSQFGTYDRGLASTGGYRSGVGLQGRNDLGDTLERGRKTDIANFTSQVNDWGNNYYNELSNNYYKNGSAFVMPTLPTLDDYLKQNPVVSQAYNTQTNVPTTYKNPLLF